MFRSSSIKAATNKLVHNTTVPSLAGHSDLQNLITAEKGVLHSIQSLASDLSKASEALKQWGNGLGADISDVLTASTMLMFMFSEALNIYANHEAAIRGNLKSIRMREESLHELKQRRRALSSRVNSAQMKAAKAAPGSKQYHTNQELFLRLQDDLRKMDADVAVQEASHLDFTRQSTKGFMGLKFGGLQELCNRGFIVAHNGKLVITEIPLHPTQLGSPRPAYVGGARTGWLVNDAQILTKSVFFSEGLFPFVPVTAPPALAAPPSPPPKSSGPDRPASRGTSPPKSPGPSGSSQPQRSPAIPYQGAVPIPIIDESGSDIPSLPTPSPSNAPNTTWMKTEPTRATIETHIPREATPVTASPAPDPLALSFYPLYLPDASNKGPSIDIAPFPDPLASTIPRSGSLSYSSPLAYSTTKRTTPRGGRSRHSNPPPHLPVDAEEQHGETEGVPQTPTDVQPDHLPPVTEDPPQVVNVPGDSGDPGSELPSYNNEEKPLVSIGGDNDKKLADLYTNELQDAGAPLGELSNQPTTHDSEKGAVYLGEKFEYSDPVETGDLSTTLPEFGDTEGKMVSASGGF